MMNQESSTSPTILVTGSEGFIGDRLVHASYPHYRVASFDIARPKKSPLLQDFIHCDMTSDASVGRALSELREKCGSHLASVVHLAAYYNFSGEPSPLYEELTIEGTRRLLNGLREFDVDQFIFASTLLVMKPAEKDEEIDELSPKQAEWDYPKSKLITERVVEQERGDMKAVILRVSGVYDDECNSLPIAQHMRRIYEEQLESYVFPGDPEKGQPFVHIDDFVDCVHRVIERRRELGDFETFLIAEPDIVSYEELQDFLGSLLHGKEWPTIRIPKAVAKAGAWVREKVAPEGDEPFIKPWMIDLADQHYPVETDKANEQLGWQPKRLLRDTLSSMAADLLHDPEGWYEKHGLPMPERKGSR